MNEQDFRRIVGFRDAAVARSIAAIDQALLEERRGRRPSVVWEGLFFDAVRRTSVEHRLNDADHTALMDVAHDLANAVEDSRM